MLGEESGSWFLGSYSFLMDPRDQDPSFPQQVSMYIT